MFGLKKYRDETRLNIVSNNIAIFYGYFVICSNDDGLIVIKNNELRYSVYGSDLVISDVKRPKTVIKVKIERIELN